MENTASVRSVGYERSQSTLRKQKFQKNCFAGS